MDHLVYAIIPLTYLGLAVCLYCAVMGLLKKSLPYLVVSTVLGLVGAYVTMWSVGRFVVVLPIVTGIVVVIIWLKKRQVRKHTA